MYRTEDQTYLLWHLAQGLPLTLHQAVDYYGNFEVGYSLDIGLIAIDGDNLSITADGRAWLSPPPPPWDDPTTEEIAFFLLNAAGREYCGAPLTYDAVSLDTLTLALEAEQIGYLKGDALGVLCLTPAGKDHLRYLLCTSDIFYQDPEEEYHVTVKNLTNHHTTN